MRSMSDNWYSVYLEAGAPAGAAVVVSDEAADRLMDLLEDHSGTISAGDDSWAATVSVQAADAREAVGSGTRIIEKMAAEAGMPPWPAVRVEAVDQDVLEKENERPTLPQLVSVPEVAEVLGVSAQRVHELARGTRGFPLPVYELRTGKLWLRDAIVAFSERRDRKPGRPDRGAVMRERVTSVLLDNGLTAFDARVELNEGRVLILAIKPHGAPATQRRKAAKVVNVLHGAGLGVMAEDDSADEIEAYLAEGHPGVIFELPEELAEQALRR